MGTPVHGAEGRPTGSTPRALRQRSDSEADSKVSLSVEQRAHTPKLRRHSTRTQLHQEPRPPQSFFFFTLVTGPRRSLSLKLSDTRVYEPQIRAHLGTNAHLCRVVWGLPAGRDGGKGVVRAGQSEEGGGYGEGLFVISIAASRRRYLKSQCYSRTVAGCL